MCIRDRFDAVINFAAERHVDTSIISPAIFTKTNVEGTGVLLDACVKFAVERFHPVSYTHLDVYKRQLHDILACASWSFLFICFR